MSGAVLLVLVMCASRRLTFVSHSARPEPCTAWARSYVNLVFARSCYDLTKLLSKTHDIDLNKYMANIPKDIEDMNQAAAAIDNEGSGSEVHALKAYINKTIMKTELENKEDDALLKYMANRWHVPVGSGAPSLP